MPQPKPFRNSRPPAQEADEETEFPHFKKPVGNNGRGGTPGRDACNGSGRQGGRALKPSSCSGSWPGCWRRASALRPSSSCSYGAISTASIRHRSHSAGKRRSWHRKSSALPCRWKLPIPRMPNRRPQPAAAPAPAPATGTHPRAKRAQSDAAVRPPFHHPAPGGRGGRYRRAVARRRVERHRYPADPGHRFSRQRPLLLRRRPRRGGGIGGNAAPNLSRAERPSGVPPARLHHITLRSPGNGRWRSGFQADPS